ncbi:hypothetical protein ACWD62_35930 [Streptomyces sp. NPDC005146]
MNIGYAGTYEWAISLAAGMAVGPFLSAIANHFGTLLAEEIDEGTRLYVRKFLRRERESRDQGSDQFFQLKLHTKDDWKVRIWDGIPAEALTQLAALCNAEPPVEQVIQGAIFWLDNSWCAMAYVNGGTVTPYVWDVEANRWIRR